MVDFLKFTRRKTLFSEIMYYVLNVGLAVALFVLSQVFPTPIVAILLVLLSKWRVFAVRPRYWWTNIQANMVDVIVGVGIVTLMYLPNMPQPAQIVLAVLYALWLTVLKPMSKRSSMMIQSFCAIVFGVSALYAVSYEWPVAIVVLCMAVIGYSVARHFLYSYEEKQIVFLSAMWGLLFAEIGWLAYYWTYSYALFGVSALRLPQVTIVVVLMSFVAERVYRSWARNKRIIPSDVIAPAIFSSLLIAVIFLFFNSVTI